MNGNSNHYFNNKMVHHKTKSISNGIINKNLLNWNFQLNEWIFTLLLFIFSLSIVIGKFINLYEISSMLGLNWNDYQNAIKSINYLDVIQQYFWMIKATFSGLGIVFFTWCILLNDCNLSTLRYKCLRKQNSTNLSFQLNYLIGIINGVLVFIYSCLE